MEEPSRPLRAVLVAGALVADNVNRLSRVLGEDGRVVQDLGKQQAI